MTLDIRPLAIPDVKLIAPRRFADTRGHFTETWNEKSWTAGGLPTFDAVQDNQSLSRETGTIRGLHFQRPPHAQAKLVSCLKGRILDVAVDIRKGSKTFGRHVTVELDESGAQLFVPAGFAHGFCTLAPDTLVFYKVDAHYAPESDAGIFWADEALGIAWPVAINAAHLSPKDAALPRLKDIESPF
jgi:dTDP-4-dehydrorhamnose 3,5-epimerase